MEINNEEKWIEFMGSLRTDEPMKIDQAKDLLKEAFINAVKNDTENTEKFGIFFSGGIDSSLISLVCKQLNKNFVCYSVGLENSQDIEYADKIAKEFGFELKKIIPSLDDTEEIIKRVISITKKRDIVTVGVGAVILAAGELAKEDGIKVMFSGLGSEEIFAGYQRHKESDDINEECWTGLKNMWQRDIMRDVPIAGSLGIELKTPFLNREVIKIAMQIDAKHKINDEQNKIVIREIAEELGLGEYSWRKKKAAQYGSSVDKAIEKLAKRNGFKYKKDYLNSL